LPEPEVPWPQEDGAQCETDLRAGVEVHLIRLFWGKALDQPFHAVREPAVAVAGKPDAWKVITISATWREKHCKAWYWHR